jgi:hypothetical protein
MQQSKSALSISAEILSLAKGIYQFTVKSATPRRVGDEAELVLPAVHVGLGPGVAPDQIELMTGLRSDGAWLYEPRDIIILKVKSSPTLVLMTSARVDGMDPLEVSVERLDAPKKTASRTPPPVAPMPALPAPMPAGTFQALTAGRSGARSVQPDGRAPDGALRLQVMVHISNHGDKSYVDSFWAGELGESLPIEAFAISPMEGIRSEQVEYKALGADGRVTPWISGGALCGSRGTGVPLVGFMVRLRDGGEDLYDCEYRGAFRSGRSVGPVTNGAPCKGAGRDDYLEGIQLTIVERRKSSKSVRQAPAMPPLVADAETTHKRMIGPKFSVFREETH